VNSIIENHIAELQSICEKLQVQRLYAFGSSTSDHFTEQSDMDFLLSFIDGIPMDDYTDNYFELHIKLQELFDREIDLVTERSLSNPIFIAQVNTSKRLVYER
jgi:hypothetical protein